MSAPKSNTRSTIMLGLCGILVAYFLVVKPKAAEVDDAKSNLATSTAALENAKKELSALGPQADDAELAKLLVQVPRTADTPAFFDQISASAATNGVQVSNITFTPPSTSSMAIGSEVLVTLRADGLRDNVDAFMKSIAELPRLAIIDQANVNPRTDPGQPIGNMSGPVMAELSVVLFTGVAPTTAS